MPFGVRHEETEGHRARFYQICQYLLRECVTDRPLTEAEILSAWNQAKRYTIDDLLDQADDVRKRAKGE